MALTQAEFIEEVAKELEPSMSKLGTKGVVKKVLELTKGIAVDQLGTEAQATLPILGIKLVVHKRAATKARMGRNPATGEAIKIGPKPASKQLKARVMKALKDEVL
jgi:nucleoid DNA-binding protein